MAYEDLERINPSDRAQTITAASPAPLALAPANWAMWGASERLECGIGLILPHAIRRIVAF
jgi:hypothetical protein